MKFITTLPLLISCLFLGACMSSKKMDRLVAKHYTKRDINLSTSLKYFTSHNPDSSIKIRGYSQSHNTSKLYIPVIIYHYAAQKKTCELNPLLLNDVLTKEMNSIAVQQTMKEKFEYYDVQLVLKHAPTRFFSDYESHTITPFIIVPIWVRFSKELLSSPTTDFVVNYKITRKSDTALIKSGSISRPMASSIGLRGFWVTRKEFVDDYLNGYDQKSNELAQEIAQTITQELNTL